MDLSNVERQIIALLLNDFVKRGLDMLDPDVAEAMMDAASPDDVEALEERFRLDVIGGAQLEGMKGDVE